MSNDVILNVIKRTDDLSVLQMPGSDCIMIGIRFGDEWKYVFTHQSALISVGTRLDERAADV